MPYQIRRAAVIGSGTMGGGIAAHLANVGIPVDLFDIVPFELTGEEQSKGLTLDDPKVRYRIVNQGWDAVLNARPAALFSKENADLVRLGNLEDDFDRLAEADYIIEAIVENLKIKQELMARLEKIRKPDTIIATNTSGIPIHDIAKGRSKDFCQHFLGMHFFNPPRYLKLLEIIPHSETKPEIVKAMTEFGETELGKGVVVCKDTPNFIANRIFSAAGSYDLGYALENGYTIEEIDALTGPLIGRPKTATFRLLDLVGLDVMGHVNTNLYDAIPHDESRDLLIQPKAAALLEQMLEQGWLGNKTKVGFYKQVTVNGGKEFWVLDLESMEHKPPQKVRFESVGQYRKVEPVGERVKCMVEADDRAGTYIRNILYNVMAYSANRIPEIADSVLAIDQAVKWGYVHQIGPFELWDVLGMEVTIPQMERAGFEVAQWIKDMVASGTPTFYQYENGEAVAAFNAAQGKYEPLEKKPKEIKVHTLHAHQKEVAGNEDVSLLDMGDGIGLFEIHSKVNTFTLKVIDFAHEVLNKHLDQFDGLVIGNDGDMFSAGANVDVAQISQLAAQSGKTPAEFLEGSFYKSGQEMMMGFRYAPKPVVAAPFQMTLGGGAEITMAADRIVAHAELYMGLVEIGVGLVPGWGGCKELLRRVVNPVMQIENADPLAPLTKVFEQIGLAKVATSAQEAREAGFLGACDRIITNRAHLLAEAKREARYLADNGYHPPKPAKIYAAGRDVLSAMRTQLFMLHDAGYASEHDVFITSRLAWILCGGDLSAPQWVDEWYILDLERTASLELGQHPKSIERMMHMLQTGKPLRN